MSPREKLHALASERGYYVRTTHERGGHNVNVEVGKDAESRFADGPTEEAACLALLAKLEPPDTLAALLDAMETIEFFRDCGPVRAWHNAGRPRPRQMAPEAVALVEAISASGQLESIELIATPGWSSPEDEAFRAWVAAGRPVWAVKP